jgi:hypothetical protein
MLQINARKGFGLLITALGLGSQAWSPAIAGSQHPEATVTLSMGPNLLIDDYLIAESHGLARTVHPPAKHPDPVFHTTTGYVRYDPPTQRFRMIYIEGPDKQYAVVESPDGIDWVKPDLGLVEVDGSKHNNLIEGPKGHYPGQFFDDGPEATDPERRYKLAYFAEHRGMSLAFSPDGLRFTAFPGNPVIPENANEIPVGKPASLSVISDIINGCWDPLNQEYLIICKIWEGGYPGEPPHAPNGYCRVVGLTTSKDFVTWERPKIILRPDLRNGLEEYYSFSPMIRGNLYIGCLRILRDDLPATVGGPVEGIGWTELVTSRDGLNWTRYQEKFLDCDPQAGQFDHAMAWCGEGVLVGDQEYYFYSALLSGHKTDRVVGRKTGLAILRKNGFVSRDAGRDGGFLKTPLAVLPGARLTLNAVIRGSLRVRLIDAAGKAWPGFDWKDCAELKGDSVALPVQWKTKQPFPQGKRVSLEFKLKDGELYGFDVFAQ